MKPTSVHSSQHESSALIGMEMYLRRMVQIGHAGTISPARTTANCTVCVEGIAGFPLALHSNRADHPVISRPLARPARPHAEYVGKGLGSGFKVRSSKFGVQGSEWKVEWKEVGEPANRRMGEEFGKSSERVRSSKFDVQSSELNKSLKDQKIIRLWKAHSITKNTDHRSLITDNLLRKGWMPPHPTLFLRKDVFEKYGLYRTDMKIAADYEMILRLFYKYKVYSYYLPVVTYCMTTGGASNKSIGNIITKSSEDLKALKMHGFRFPLLTLFYKNLKKIPQFF
ncbi:MAG: hypothetical protein R6W68_08185 [Ignavibacteriaceae bacterium]